MELYQLKMEMEGDLHDHINKFNQLVSQLLNADDKLSDEEQTFLLLLASLPRSFKVLVQTLLVGRSTLNLDEVTVTLRENERMMRTENVDDEHNAIVVVVLLFMLKKEVAMAMVSTFLAWYNLLWKAF